MITTTQVFSSKVLNLSFGVFGFQINLSITKDNAEQ